MKKYMTTIVCSFILWAVAISPLATTVAKSQIAEYEVLTFLSGDRIDDEASTYLVKMVIDSARSQLLCLVMTNESDLPVTPTALMGWPLNKRGMSAYFAILDMTCSKLLYASYITGRATDVPLGAFLTDEGDDVLISGETYSDDFPVSDHATQKNLKGGLDIWYARFNLTLQTFVYISYLGGNGYDSFRNGMLARDGRMLFCGYTDSNDLPIDRLSISRRVDPAQGEAAIFVLREDTLRSVVCFGGDYKEMIASIRETDSSFVFIGETSSLDIPLTNNAYQGVFGGTSDLFILRTDKYFREMKYCTYIGGTSNDYQRDVLQQGDIIHIVGLTNGSLDFPHTHTPIGGNDTLGYYSGIHVMYNAANDSMLYSGLIIGNGAEEMCSISALENDNVLLNMISNSDTIFSIVKSPPGEWGDVMQLWIEFNIRNYQVGRVQYVWNAGWGSVLADIITSSAGMYFIGYTNMSIGCNSGGYIPNYKGGTDAYIGCMTLRTNSVQRPKPQIPRLVTLNPYPNPAGLNASVILTGAMGSYELRLSNLEGRLISSFRIVHTGENATTISLPLTGLAAGRYLLVAHDATGTPVARSAVLVQ